MMKKNGLILLVCFLLLPGFSGSFAQDASSDEIRMTIPRSVIVKMIKAALPVAINTGSSLKGEVWIQAIDKLKIGKDQVAFEMNLRGKDIKLETRLGKQTLMLDLGQMNTFLDCTAKLRFDPATHKLFITPQLTPIARETAAENKTAADLVPLLGLANGVEFPVDIQEFQPFVTELGRDRFSIDLKLTRIFTEPDKVVVTGLPRFEKAGPVK